MKRLSEEEIMDELEQMESSEDILDFLEGQGYVRLAEDQSLPPNKYSGRAGQWYQCWKDAQLSMINSGFKKIELKNE